MEVLNSFHYRVLIIAQEHFIQNMRFRIAM